MKTLKKQNKQKGEGGLGFMGLLALLFIGLKLGGIISWSWWLVTLPIWGSAVLAIFIAIIAVIYIVSHSNQNLV